MKLCLNTEMKTEHKKILYSLLSLILFILVAYYISIDINDTNNDTKKVEEMPFIGQDLGLKLIFDRVYFQTNCSYRNDLIEIPIDPKTFQIYNQDYFGDKDSIWNNFFTGCNPPTKVSLEPLVDIKSFKIVSEEDHFASDKHSLIVNISVPKPGSYSNEINVSRRIDGLKNNFEYISDKIFRSDGKIYYLKYPYDHTSLTLLPSFPKDVERIIYAGHHESYLYIFTPTKIFSFNPYSDTQSIDSTLKEFSGVDPVTFFRLIDGYWADKNGVYFNRTKLEHASSTDFRKIDGGYYTSQNHIYYKDNKISDVSGYQFRMIPGQPTREQGVCGSSTYWTDGKDVFYEGKALGANPLNFTFSIGQGFKCYSIDYAWDWKKYFYEGKEIRGIDPSSFRIIKDRYARDANHVYYGGEILDGNPDKLEKDILNGKIHEPEPFS